MVEFASEAILTEFVYGDSIDKKKELSLTLTISLGHIDIGSHMIEFAYETTVPILGDIMDKK